MKSRKVEIKQIILVVGIIFLINFFITANFNSYQGKNNHFIENDINPMLSSSSQYQLEWYGLWDDNGMQYGMGLVVDSFKNIYQSGYTYSGPNGLIDGIIFKTDASGNQLWNQSWGTSNNDKGWDIAIDSNNYIYVVGNIDNGGKIILLKFDSSGSQIWNRTWNDLSNANGRSIVVDSEDNLYVLGYAASYDLVIIKYNSSGSKIWQEIWGGAEADGNFDSDLVLDSQDNLYVASSTWSYGAVGGDALIMKYDSSGNKIWNRTFGGVNSDIANGIALDNDDNIYIGGYTTSFGPGSSSAFIAKFDNSGNYLWNKSWAGPDNITGKGFDLTSDPLGNVYLTGYIIIPPLFTDSELAFLLKYNTSGSLMLNKTWGTGIDGCEGYGIHVDSLYNIYISGYVNLYDGKNGLAFLLKYEELTKPAPSITINSPSSNDYIGSEAPLFNITIKHRYPLNSTWYTIDGGMTNYSVGGTKEVGTLGEFYYTNIVGEVDQDAWNSVFNDITLRFYTNDTLGNHTYSEVLIKKSNFDLFHTWGGVNLDEGHDMAIDSSNNVYVVGKTASFTVGGYDIFLVKYNNSGAQEWNQTWGEANNDEGYGIALDSTGSIYVVGINVVTPGTDNDMVLVKYNSFGVQQWNRTWGGGNDDRGYDVAVDDSGNIFVTGNTVSFGPGECGTFVVKYSSAGTQLWNQTWGGGDREYGSGIALAQSGNIYLTGSTSSYGPGLADFFLVKLNSSGDFKWSQYYGFSGKVDGGAEIKVDSQENIYVAGTIDNSGIIDTTLLKYNNSGSLLWNRAWGGTSADTLSSLELDSLGNIYLTGSTGSYGAEGKDMLLMKYDNSGTLQWNRTWGGSLDDGGNAIRLDESNDIFITGYTASFGAGNNDMFLVKFDNSAPVININSPSQHDDYGISAPTFNITITEPSPYYTWYTLDDGITNVTFNGLIGTINQTEWEKFGNGSVTIKFYANDSYGFMGNANVRVYKDTIKPISSILFTPHSGTNYVNRSTVFTLNANDGVGSGISLIKYKINNSAWINYSAPFNLSSFDYGDYIITYQATDLVGNVELENTASIALVTYDIIIINIVSPGTNDYFGMSPPTFEISIIGTNIDTSWYTLDGSLNITFSGLTGTIDSVEWGKFGDGGVNFRFYTNNTYGVLGYAEVIVNKDIIAPISTISFTPYNGTNIVVGSTLFTLTGNDGAGSGVSMIYYRINYDDYAEYDAPFNFTDFEIGNYLISYYAIDLVGNIESENTVLVTLVEVETPIALPTGSPGIPGYELISLIAVSLLVMATIINRKFKKINH